MKKIIFLSVLALGLMSFIKSEGMNKKDSEDGYKTCCTATLTYNGEYHSSYTACVDGIGPETTNLACGLARAKALAFVASQP